MRPMDGMPATGAIVGKKNTKIYENVTGCYQLQNLDMVEPELQNLITWKGAKSLGGKGLQWYGKIKGLGLFQNLQQEQDLQNLINNMSERF